MQPPLPWQLDGVGADRLCQLLELTQLLPDLLLSLRLQPLVQLALALLEFPLLPLHAGVVMLVIPD